ncbi:MAG: helix-turn-helix domain-containing protein [Acholeplasmatales bacterium]|nr:helix-turn-helix domain-containing protein [Acholeplasmatales bacterium]
MGRKAKYSKELKLEIIKRYLKGESAISLVNEYGLPKRADDQIRKWVHIYESLGAKPLFHSDRGFQYTSKQFKIKLDQAGTIQSMSRVGRCIDNGPMEGFWGTLKSEMFYG